MSSWSPVSSTIALSAVQAVIFYGLFELWRHKSTKKDIFQPRRAERPNRTPDEPPKGLFSWIKTIGKVDDVETLRCVGMDTFVFLRFLKFMCKVTFLPGLVAMAVLIPIYYFGEEKDEPDATEFNRLTLARVEAQSRRLWVSLLYMYFFVGNALYHTWKDWEYFVEIRAKHFAEGDPDMDSEFVYAAIVEDIPHELRSSKDLYGYFNKLFPGKVSYASLCLETASLDKKIAERQKVLVGIEKVVAVKAAKPDGKEPMVNTGGIACFGNKVPKEAHLRSELDRLNEEVEAEHARIAISAAGLPSESESGPQVGSSTGFVTLNSSAAKLSVTQLNLSGKYHCMRAFPAPAPEDLIWSNVTVPKVFSDAKRQTANMLWCVGILLWAIPVAFVQGIANLDSLSEKWTWMVLPDKSSFAYGLLSGYLPVIALIVLMIILPMFIEAVAIKYVRLKSQSEVDVYVFKWHFGFQVANLWLTLLGGSLINQIEPILGDVSSIVELIALALPGVSQFFLNAMIVSLLGGLIMNLSGLVPVIVTFIMGKITKEAAKTDRDLRAARKPGSLKWGLLYPPIIFHLLVVFSYAALVPVMVAFGMVLFALTYVVHKNQALYVNVQNIEGGGKIRYLLHGIIMACLYMGEAVFMVYMGIKEASAQSTLALILIGITAVVHFMVGNKFVNPSKSMCMESAVELDTLAAKATSEGISTPPSGDCMDAAPFEGKAYAQISMRKSTWETVPEPYRLGEVGSMI